MKATKEYYKKMRGMFIRLGYSNEVKMLDKHFEQNLDLDKNNSLLYIVLEE